MCARSPGTSYEPAVACLTCRDHTEPACPKQMGSAVKIYLETASECEKNCLQPRHSILTEQWFPLPCWLCSASADVMMGHIDQTSTALFSRHVACECMVAAEEPKLAVSTDLIPQRVLQKRKRVKV